ncbi:MAG: SagB/ThcOx family dehydrogenase [Actinophytocola sp.]|uniref:SagB/ThcOx family dehydrogenase n=1 Tax=Actinophytocola sp. TaxID=1872138 RepID=UPI001324BAA0|nr:SagB family peptide dehydrogenase [Actinophytocola sp.]MPZ81192.1 SagB/ThcOx family dehydrogenase [Actinophytocola sp.]
MPVQPPAPQPATFRLFSLRDDVIVADGPYAGVQTLSTRWGELEVDTAKPVLRECLDRMTLGPVSLANITGGDISELTDMLDKLPGVVVHTMDIDDLAGPLLSAVPVSERARFTLPDVHPTDVVRLSRFAALRSSEDELVVESPLAHHRVVLHRPLAGAVAGGLGRAIAVTDLAASLAMDPGLVAEIVAYLVGAEMVLVGERYNGSARFAEDIDPRLVQWSHHDLLFHGRSRLGRHDEPLGATYRHVDALPPQPAVRPVPDGRRFSLHRPTIGGPSAAEPSLTEVIEGRRSYRGFAEQPLSARQLGELLYRTARVRSLVDATGAGGVGYTVSDRPYPSSDALYELELYVTIENCDGLVRGIYHYDPFDHALTLISTDEAQLAELLDAAKVLTGTMQRPPALITMTARMARLSWVYDGIAYATALKHVGVLQQTLYLVATAMNLAPCALAAGASDTAIEALRLDWPAEVTIGEFVVGLRPG